MSEYSATNITQSILPSDDKKYPLKENSTINWNMDMLMRYFEGVRKMKGSGDSQILPSSPETFFPSLNSKFLINTLPHDTYSQP